MTGRYSISYCASRQSVFGQEPFGRSLLCSALSIGVGNELAVFVVVEAGGGSVGEGRLKVISDDLDILLSLDPTLAG